MSDIKEAHEKARDAARDAGQFYFPEVLEAMLSAYLASLEASGSDENRRRHPRAKGAKQMINLVKRLREHYDDDGHLQKEAAYRIEALEAALRKAQEALALEDKLITDAQEKLCAYLRPDSGIDDREIANSMLEHFDCSRQRDVQSRARAALAEIEKVLK